MKDMIVSKDENIRNERYFLSRRKIELFSFMNVLPPVMKLIFYIIKPYI